ncbi:hypothetical protein ACUSIJ_02345 [Pseudochelatococcus sp. B33]
MSDFSVSSRAPSVGQGVASTADSAQQGTLGKGRGPDGEIVEWQPSVTKSQSLPTGAGVSSDKLITARAVSAGPQVERTADEDVDGEVSDTDVSLLSDLSSLSDESDDDSDGGYRNPPPTIRRSV